MRRVVVTGIGLITPIGIGKEEFWKNNKEGKSGIGDMPELEKFGFESKAYGYVKNFKPEQLGLTLREIRRMDRITQFGVLCTDQAVKDSKIDLSKIDKNRVGVNIANAVAGTKFMDEEFSVLTNNGKEVVNPEDISPYARNDENPSEAALFDDLRKLTGTIFVTGFTTFYKMIGEQKLRELLNKLVALTNAKLKIVVLCYQCEKFLAFSDSRYRTWVYDVKGITSTNPNLVFVSPEMPDWDSTQSIEGIQNVPFFIEQNKCDEVHVKTAKTKNNYNHSLFDISEQTKLFDVVVS